MIGANVLQMRDKCMHNRSGFLPAILFLAIAVFLSIPSTLQAAISLQERQALIAFYLNTDGPNWTNKTGWLGAIGTECSWFGVVCDYTNTNVDQLDLAGNQLRGRIPAELGDLTNLHRLHLNSNQLSGPIPAELGILTNLESLNVSVNQLTGEIPGELGNLTNLQTLYLHGNQLAGSMPAELGTLSNLRYLGLGGNRLTGGIPDELGNLTNLRELYLYNNQLTGSISAGLWNLVSLQNLDLSSNQLSGSIPSEFGNLTKLQDLYLSQNMLSGSIPAELGNLANLHVLFLHNNRLSGSIPSSLGNLSALQMLSLSGNQLSGSIPAELGNLADLQSLSLFGNQLTGDIPAELGNLANLQTLSLFNNQLSGSIPHELGNLINLQTLLLKGNRLRGDIPAEFGNLTSLWLLNLGENQLSGGIPVELESLAGLQYLNLQYNALYAADQSLISFLNSKDPFWQNTQTVAPAALFAASQSLSSILVSWSPIAYTSDSGRYEIYQGTTSGGPYVFAGSTADKTASSFTLTGLSPFTTYYFVIRTITDPHAKNQNSVISGYSAEVHAATTGREISVNPGGAAIAGTAGSSDSIRVGYSETTLTSGSAPYGAAIFSYKPNGVTLSEAGVPATPPTVSARLFIDYRSDISAVPGHPEAGTVNVNTGMAVVNHGDAEANVTYTLRDFNGNALSIGHGILAEGKYFSCFIDQLKETATPDFEFPSDFASSTQFGSLEITSDQPLSILALRGTNNQRNDFLITTSPVADLTRPLSSDAIYFPQFADGGGYTTSLILLNTSTMTETGLFQILDGNGAPLVVNQAGGAADSSFRYSIQPGGVFHFQTSGFAAETSAGWVRFIPDSGTDAPVGSGVFGYTTADVLVSESGIPAAAATTHARIYVDLSGGHNTGLAIANLEQSIASITINAFQTDGITAAGTSQEPLSLPANGYTAAFADQIIPGLPDGFTGVLDISSATPFAALTLRSLVNERGDFLMTTFPVADANQPAPSPIVFPHIVDGGGYTTQFVLISAGEAADATLSFYDAAGTPIDFIE